MTSFLLQFSVWCLGAAVLSAFGGWVILEIVNRQRSKIVLPEKQARTV